MPNYVLIQDQNNKVTQGGLALPDKQDNTPSIGIVMVATKELKMGTTVWYKHFAGEEVGWNNLKLKAVHVDDIIAWEGGEV